MTGGGSGGLGPGFVQSLRKVVAGIVLLRDDGAALLQLRDDEPSIQDPGIWAVPGGCTTRNRKMERPAMARLVAGPARLTTTDALRGWRIRAGLIGTGLA